MQKNLKDLYFSHMCLLDSTKRYFWLLRAVQLVLLLSCFGAVLVTMIYERWESFSWNITILAVVGILFLEFLKRRDKQELVNMFSIYKKHLTFCERVQLELKNERSYLLEKAPSLDVSWFDKRILSYENQITECQERIKFFEKELDEL